jgi:hypothetical protein
MNLIIMETYLLLNKEMIDARNTLLISRDVV